MANLIAKLLKSVYMFPSRRFEGRGSISESIPGAIFVLGYFALIPRQGPPEWLSNHHREFGALSLKLHITRNINGGIRGRVQAVYLPDRSLDQG